LKILRFGERAQEPVLLVLDLPLELLDRLGRGRRRLDGLTVTNL